jgi:hypothetical protein
MCKLVSYPNCANLLLNSKVDTQNGRLHVKPHDQIL